MTPHSSGRPKHGQTLLYFFKTSLTLLKTPVEKVWMKTHLNGPGEEEGDGGRQKSQSEDRSHTLPSQLSGELEGSDPGDSSLDPGDSLSAPELTSSCGSKLDSA